MSIYKLLFGAPDGQNPWKALAVNSIISNNIALSTGAPAGATSIIRSTGSSGAFFWSSASAFAPAVPLLDGQVAIGRTANPDSPSGANLTAGSNIGITNAPGKITIALTANPSVDTISINNGSQLSTYLQNQAWVPVLKIGGSSSGITYSVQTGLYSKIGRTMCVNGALTVTNTNSLSGVVVVGALPFAAATANDNLQCSWGTFTFDTLKGPGLVATSSAASTDFGLFQLNSDGTTTQCSQACFSGGTSAIKFSGTYQATS